ncbi:MAG: winged helix-turn-helix domain-containing protein [Bacteroidales bacterium]|nr:winged helix-turn-helix domain-containing protein [Bacteroidales bacterium]
MKRLKNNDNIKKLTQEDIGDNDMFAEHSWCFRNALVRANYKNHTKSIHATIEFLLHFFENLLLGENHILKNREMHILFVDPLNDPVKIKNAPVNDLVNNSVKRNILLHLKQNLKANYRELADIVGYSTATIKRHIQELKKM